jgi:protein-disulfide isomerase/uncharacterized membrane protein
LLVPIALAVTASAMLLVDYTRPTGFFCADDGGCGALKQTALARPFGVPLPAVGLVAFFFVGFLALRQGSVARKQLLGVTALGGLFGFFLLLTQLRLRTVCPYCVVVDTSAVAVALVSAYRFHAQWDVPARFGLRAGFLGSLSLCAVAPFALAGKAALLPAPIAAELARTPPGIVTVIDFADFECPFCRATHEELVPLLDERRGQVRVVRKHVPLPHIHPHAMEGAKAACCAELQGQGEAMADALFRMPGAEMTVEGCTKVAVHLKLDERVFRQCMQDAKIDARIQEDRELFRAVQGRGLPTLWIGTDKIEGAADRERLRQALDEALARARS